MEINGERSKQFVVVKSWHTLLVLLGMVAAVFSAFYSLKYNAEATERRVTEMEQSTVRKDQFNEMKEDIKRRLQRIEDKLDAKSKH